MKKKSLKLINYNGKVSQHIAWEDQFEIASVHRNLKFVWWFIPDKLLRHRKK